MQNARILHSRAKSGRLSAIFFAQNLHKLYLRANSLLSAKPLAIKAKSAINLAPIAMPCNRSIMPIPIPNALKMQINTLRTILADRLLVLIKVNPIAIGPESIKTSSKIPTNNARDSINSAPSNHCAVQQIRPYQ